MFYLFTNRWFKMTKINVKLFIKIRKLHWKDKLFGNANYFIIKLYVGYFKAYK